MLDITLSGVEAVFERLETMAGIDQIVDSVMTDWAADVMQMELAGSDKYPPPLENQHYQRTGDLGNGWDYTVFAARVTFRNAMPYAPNVVGEVQDAIHFGRWWVASQRIASRFGEIGLMLEASMQQIWDRGLVYDVRASRFRNTATGRFTSLGR